MKTHLGRSLLALLIYLAIFFNVERLDFGADQNAIDMHSFIYAFTTLTMVLILLAPFLRRVSVWAILCVGVSGYFALRLFWFNHDPLLDSNQLYLTIAEVALYALAVVLTREVALNLIDFEEAIKNITFADARHKVLSLEAANETIQNEILRGRRHQRPLTVMVIAPDPESIEVALHRSVQDVQQTMMARYVATGLARVISKQLRRIDVLIDKYDDGRLVLLSPETTAEGTKILAGRIRAMAQEQLGVAVYCGVAAFPDNALTYEELVAQAELNLLRSKTLAQEPTETAASQTMRA